MDIDRAAALMRAGHVPAEGAVIYNRTGASVNHDPPAFASGSVIDYQAVADGWI